MPVSHYIKIMQPNGTVPFYIAQNPPGGDLTKGGFTNLVYNNVLSGFGTLKFSLYGGHLALATLIPYCQVEVWRTWPEMGIAPYRDWSGLFLDEESSITADGGDLFTLTCYGDAIQLADAAVAWPAGTANRSQFTNAKGETIMKTLVDYNCCTNATAANGRDETNQQAGLSIDTDGSNGNSLDWACANENLLNTLQNLATSANAGGDFTLLKTGAAAWLFKWGQWNCYSGITAQVSADRTASVKFSLELGNMANPHYYNTRSNEKTVALVKGIGTGSDRAIAIRTGVNYSASRKREIYVNASSQATTTAALNATGDAALKASQAQEIIEFDALPLPNIIYGKHWFLGDKVAVKYKSHSLTPRVVMVTTKPDPNQGEIITPGMAVNV